MVNWKNLAIMLVVKFALYAAFHAMFKAMLNRPRKAL